MPAPNALINPWEVCRCLAPVTHRHTRSHIIHIHGIQLQCAGMAPFLKVCNPSVMSGIVTLTETVKLVHGCCIFDNAPQDVCGTDEALDVDTWFPLQQVRVL
jgi:hypothetical protein